MWLNSRRNSDVAKSSENKDLKCHPKKFREKLEEPCSVIRYMVMVGLKNLFASSLQLVRRQVDLNSEKTLATGGIFLLIFTAISCIFRFKMSNASQLLT